MIDDLTSNKIIISLRIKIDARLPRIGLTRDSGNIVVPSTVTPFDLMDTICELIESKYS